MDVHLVTLSRSLSLSLIEMTLAIFFPFSCFFLMFSSSCDVGCTIQSPKKAIPPGRTHAFLAIKLPSPPLLHGYSHRN